MPTDDQSPEKQNSDSVDLAKIADFDINNLNLEATEQALRDDGFVKIPVMTKILVHVNDDGTFMRLPTFPKPIMEFKDWP